MVQNVIYNSMVSGRKRVLGLESGPIRGRTIFETISREEDLPIDWFRVQFNGKLLENETILEKAEFWEFRVYLPLVGGKGGFGSMLRAIGAQIEKTTNKEACRDLSGRRLRDINAEKRAKDWIRKQASRKEEQEKRRKDRLDRLRRVPNVEFKDDDYFKNREENPEKVEEALEYGLKQALANDEAGGSGSGLNKRKTEEAPSNEVKPKRSRMWTGLDNLSDEEEEVTSAPATDSDQDADQHNASAVFKKLADRSHEIVSNAIKGESIVSQIDGDSSETSVEGSNEKSEASDSSVEKEEPKSRGSTLLSLLPPPESEKKKNEKNIIPKNEVTPKALDMMNINGKEELIELGLDRLKSALLALGMKCGGTLEQRAERLWLVKGLKQEEIPKTLLANSKK